MPPIPLSAVFPLSPAAPGAWPGTTVFRHGLGAGQLSAHQSTPLAGVIQLRPPGLHHAISSRGNANDSSGFNQHCKKPRPTRVHSATLPPLADGTLGNHGARRPPGATPPTTPKFPRLGPNPPKNSRAVLEVFLKGPQSRGPQRFSVNGTRDRQPTGATQTTILSPRFRHTGRVLSKLVTGDIYFLRTGNIVARCCDRAGLARSFRPGRLLGRPPRPATKLRIVQRGSRCSTRPDVP